MARPTDVSRGTRPERGAARGSSLAVAATVALVLGACAQKPNVDPRLAVTTPTPPKVVAEGEPVPKGGGVEQAAEAAVTPTKTFVAGVQPDGYSAEGLASWYGSQFHGRMTSNGEVFDMASITAAHPSLPLPSYARVTNTSNGKSIVVRVNDRGPFHKNRLIDVSSRTAEILDFKRKGMARVRIDYVGPASLNGSDEEKLLATFRDRGASPSGTQLAALVETPGPGPVTVGGKAPLKLKPVIAAVNAPPELRTDTTPPSGYAVASASTEPVAAPVPAPATTPKTNVASRIAAGFGGFNSQPLGQNAKPGLVQPVLSGFAFDPTIFAPPR